MFDNILGNERNKELLEKTINSGKMSHSYMFLGIEGIGKKMIAKDFAKAILCTSDHKYCNNCKSCIEFETNNNPDFMFIEPNEGKVKIEQIREMQRRISEKPIISTKKVYIINNAETMTIEAQNCLLKTLEEPPEYANIILICSNESSILSTIKSRCTRIYFEQLTNDELKEYDDTLSNNIIELSQGSIGKALKIKQNETLYENIETLLNNLQNKDLIEITQMSEEIYKAKEEIDSILEYMNVILLNLGKTDTRYIKAIEIVENTKKRLKANSNYDMCIDNLLFNIWEEINEKNNWS